MITSVLMMVLVVLVLLPSVALVTAWLAYGKGAARGYALAQQARTLRAALHDMKLRKDEAYRERNMLAITLAAVLQEEGLVDEPGIDEPGSGWQLYRGHDAHFKGWETCLYFEPPKRMNVGQLCWHFPRADAWMVDMLGLREHPTGWDKRTREEKYGAMEAWLACKGAT